MLFWFRVAGQIVLLSAIALLGDAIATLTQLPVPGALIGMALLYIALWRGWVRLEWFAAGADILIRDLLLFFIPAAVGIMQYTDLFGTLGAFLVTSVVLSILIVLWVISASTVLMMHLRRRKWHRL